MWLGLQLTSVWPTFQTQDTQFIYSDNKNQQMFTCEMLEPKNVANWLEWQNDWPFFCRLTNQLIIADLNNYVSPVGYLQSGFAILLETANSNKGSGSLQRHFRWRACCRVQVVQLTSAENTFRYNQPNLHLGAKLLVSVCLRKTNAVYYNLSDSRLNTGYTSRIMQCYSQHHKLLPPKCPRK